MTVQTMPPTPTRAAANLARKPSLNKRFPPLADRTSLPARLTGLSRQKLAREATAPDPDVRRCLAHFRLHVASVEWTNNDVNRQIGSIEMEDDDEDCTGDEPQSNPNEEATEKNGNEEPIKNIEGGDSLQTPPSQTQPEVLHVSFEVQASANDALDPPITPCEPPSEPKKEEGLLERGRNCLENVQKNFWSASGQCVPVSIAS